MAGLTLTGETNLLNLMKGTTWPGTGCWGAAPATTYVGLFTTNPTSDACTTNGSTEVSGNAYARQPITSSSGWSAISGGAPSQISNAAVITFPTPTGNWGTVIGVGIFDAVSGGNLLWWNSITGQAINTGVVASFAIGALILTAN